MSETPTAAALEIPESAYDAFIQADAAETPQLAIEAIARPVVAAELRRIAEQVDSLDGTKETLGALLLASRALRSRADELDPPAKET